jgi:hypothetical protein
MYSYDHSRLKEILSEILQQNIPEQAFVWLLQNNSSVQNLNQFNKTFITVPRKVGKQLIAISKQQVEQLHEIRPGLTVNNWPGDRLARVFLLLNLDPSEKDKYIKSIENLFLAADVNELVTLYSSLPLLAYADSWATRCAEGIRSNIGDVLEAIICNNPYPSEHLTEAAWNQMVLKAFFTEKPIEKIIGLDRRNNQQLANTLTDYAHERWAAHREVNPQLWRCVAPFLNDNSITDLEKVLASANETERKAAALALYQSAHPKAIERVPDEYKEDLKKGKLTYHSLFDKTNDYVLQ